MPSAEDRVVRMVFDNATFEKKIADTLTSLGKLNNALKFEGGTKGLSDIGAAATKVDMSTISGGIENVSKGFIALSTIAITALSRITSAAITTGTQVVKSLTLDPIIAGFQEYETNIGSIQTILANTASKGTTLDQVTAALDKLNQYSDQTIYNFGQMARNIGTFTAAGVDLETSVNSIKGIANLAAMSGSTAEQASTAMYQLSQAIASGTVKLIDWNSVVNAGMGGEAFQNALFESGKAMKTLAGVPMEMTFQQWKDAGNSFRDSLQDGWITADVLTTTLQAFSGDMTEEMLLAKGFSEEQALAILKTAQIARAAATEIKTFSQLVQTVKESISTGWADSFRIIIGNFTEAKQLWTSVNNAIGAFIQKNADARNSILQGWKDMGGRTNLIETLSDAFRNLGVYLSVIKDAFRDVFPPITSQTLINMTAAFSRFIDALSPTVAIVKNVHAIFEGFFSALSIGWTVIKEGIAFLWNIGKAIAEAFGGTVVNAMVGVSNGITNLKKSLVDGGKIHDFFVNLTEVVKAPIAFLKTLADSIKDVFSAFKDTSGDAVANVFERIKTRIQGLLEVLGGAEGIVGKVFSALESAFQKIQPTLDKIFTAISTWFKDLGKKIADSLDTGDYEAIFDALNTAFLGGIALLLAKWFKRGGTFSAYIDVGSGMLSKIGATFQELTGVLSAMQTKIKADALMKIAGAIAILTASVLVLSLIDSEALSKALAAMAVGFGQLLGAFTLLTKIISDPKTAAGFVMTAFGLGVLATAMLILSFAVAKLASLDWEEIGKGLTATVGLLGALSLAAKPLSASSKGMISAGIGLVGIATALAIMSIPMKVFASMSWEELAKGLIGVAGALGILTVAMRAMPSGPNMIAQGIGLLGVAVAINIIAGAVAIFGTMSWETIGKGMVGIAGSLGAIAIALNLMPVTTPLIAAGLVLVGVALNEIGVAMKIFAGMSWEEIGKGMASIAGSLTLLAIALQLMQGTLLGAAALTVAAIGLNVLAIAVKQFAGLSWGEIAHGLGALALSLAVFATAALLIQPAIGAMLGLGAALLLLGAGFALAGLGVWALGEGLNMLVKVAKNSKMALIEVLTALSEALPAIMINLAEGIVDMLYVFIKAAPAMAKTLDVLIGVLLDTMIKNLPKFMTLVEDLLVQLMGLLRRQGPPLIQTGFFLLISLLKGIRNNIGEIVKVVADIIVKFLEAFQKEIPRVAKELADTIITMWTTAAYEVGRVSGTLLFGIGIAFLRGMKDGAESQLGPLSSFFGEIPGKVISWIGDVLSTLWQKGVDILTGFFNGAISIIGNIAGFFIGIPGAILGWVGETIGLLVQKGKDVIQGLWNGATEIFNGLLGWIGHIDNVIAGVIPMMGDLLTDVGKAIIQGLWDGMKAIWEKAKAWLESIGSFIHDNFTSKLGIDSPSKVMHEVGVNIMEGLGNGMKSEWRENEKWMDQLNADQTIEEAFSTNLSKVLTSVADKMSTMSEFAPTITPVLDLSRVKEDASRIGGYLTSNNVPLSLSYNQAKIISKATSERRSTDMIKEPTTPRGDINFEQNIYAPKQLSTSDIYKSTRNQIRIAKEELRIP